MNKYTKDKGLRRAIQAQPQHQLPSNFAYLTMQKVEETARLRQKKADRRTFWLTVAASAVIAVTGIGGLFFTFGDSLFLSFAKVLHHDIPALQFPPIFTFLMVVFPLLLLFDYGMRQWHHKRHSRNNT